MTIETIEEELKKAQQAFWEENFIKKTDQDIVNLILNAERAK